MKFVARNIAEEERDSTAAIFHATISGVDTRCNLAIARNIAHNVAPCSWESLKHKLVAQAKRNRREN